MDTEGEVAEGIIDGGIIASEEGDQGAIASDVDLDSNSDFLPLQPIPASTPSLSGESLILANLALEERGYEEEELDEELLRQLSQSTLFVEQDAPQTETMTLFKVLIVDDEPINQKVLVDYLGSGFYDVRSVGSGQAALTMVLEEGWLPNVVLMDVMMPQMNGYEATQQLRSVYSPADLPVIMLTAKTQINDIVQGLEVGANDYLTKPIAKRELLAPPQNPSGAVPYHHGLWTVCAP